MKKKTVIYLIVFVIAIVAISIFLNTRANNQQSSATNETTEGSKAILEVSENNFENEVIKSNKKVLVDFYAIWCMPCRVLKPRINEIAVEHNEIKVVKVDVDKAPNLSNKYGIVSIPTVVIFENGEEINRVVGAVTKEKILEICGI